MGIQMFFFPLKMIAYT